MIKVNNAFELTKDCPIKLKVLKEKSDLVDSITDFIENNDLTQKKAAAIVGCEQPRMSRLLGGRMSEFSIGYLFEALAKLQLTKGTK